MNSEEDKAALFGRKKGSGPEVSFELGGLTQSGLDAIVNAANSSPAGGAVITGSCRLSSRGTKHIVHAVGPVWSDNSAMSGSQVATDACSTLQTRRASCRSPFQAS